MEKSHNHSLYPHLVAEFIEADENGGTVEAITFMTREKLKMLKNGQKRNTEEERIIKEARRRESRILSLLDTSTDGAIYGFTLTREIKKEIAPIMGDILFLYQHRIGEEAMLDLKALFESANDEPVDLVIAYKKDKKSISFIKKISLEGLK